MFLYWYCPQIEGSIPKLRGIKMQKLYDPVCPTFYVIYSIPFAHPSRRRLHLAPPPPPKKKKKVFMSSFLKVSPKVVDTVQNKQVVICPTEPAPDIIDTTESAIVIHRYKMLDNKAIMLKNREKSGGQMGQPQPISPKYTISVPGCS
jgi:hypothetical protein